VCGSAASVAVSLVKALLMGLRSSCGKTRVPPDPGRDRPGRDRPCDKSTPLR